MDKHLAGLLGAVTALAAAAPAYAAMPAPLTIQSAMAAASYADLLKPIPNAVALLQDFAATQPGPAQPGQAQAGEGLVQEVQFHHHHHHHHRYWRRRYHHHHHHHHHRYIRPF